MKLNGGGGVDTAIEAVGVPAGFITCEYIVAPGGTIANVGVNGMKVDFHLECLVADHRHHHPPRQHGNDADAAENRASRKVDPAKRMTHHASLDEILDAYETFGHASTTGALKVIIGSDGAQAVSSN